MNLRRMVVAVLVSLWLVACASTTGPLFTREMAIQRARQLAKMSVTHRKINQARVDAATAELITLQELNGLSDTKWDDDPNTLFWSVELRGAFEYESIMSVNRTPKVCESDRRIFVFDAQTGGVRIDSTPCTRVLATEGPLPTRTPRP